MVIRGENVYRNFIKPILDFIIALALLLMLWPIILITILITYIDLGNPIYNKYREREGKNGKTFLMYKIRTKIYPKEESDEEATYTRTSKLIDKLRLNELPQLINVLKGDMSLVGPRPFIPGEELPEGEIDPKRYMVRPGLTGLAQVNGGRNITHKQKLEYDAIYYDNMSLWLDIKIVIKTFWLIIVNRVDE